MKQEADAEINRHPWKIEKRGWAAAGEKAADLVEIAQRLQPVAITPRLQRKTNESVKHPKPECLVEMAADAGTDTAANQIQSALQQVQDGCQRQKCEQRRHAAARKNAIIDLQHE